MVSVAMKYLSYIILTLSVLSIATSCEIVSEELPSYDETSIVRKGDKAPAFEVESIAGELLRLPEDEPSLLILFSHTCPDCKNMMNDLQEWLNNSAKRYNIVAISRGGTTEDIIAFRDRNNLEFPIAADEKAEIYYKYATMYVPRCYVIDSDGIIRFMTYEYTSGDVEVLMSELEKLY